MSAKDEPELLSPPCNDDEVHIDSTTEYCAQWLATVSAAQHDETSPLLQAHPLSGSQIEKDGSNHSGSPRAAHACPHRATHRQTETLALRPATPSSAPSHLDATPDPEPEYLNTIPYSESPCVQAGETSKYEKRPRRKTRPGRYDTSRQHREKTTLSRRERREQKREKLRSRKAIMTNFYSSATENRHVLMKPALATGAFVNGRGSVSTPLADLTFNELTFPITQKPAPRAASSQPPNGARKRPSIQSPKLSEKIEKISKGLRVIEACPGTPTPLPRQDCGNGRKRPQQLIDETVVDTARDEVPRSKWTTPRPLKRYVDSGVDTMSHAGNFASDELDNVRHVQRHPAELLYAEQANLHAPYYNLVPAYMQHYEPNYWANGIYEHAGLQSSSDWPEHVPPHYPSQHLYSVPVPPILLDDDHQNKDYSRIAPTYDMYPEPPNGLNDYTPCSPVLEPESLYRPDEETKAFWRPNFLR